MAGSCLASSLRVKGKKSLVEKKASVHSAKYSCVVGDGVGANGGGTTIAETLLDAIVQFVGLGSLKRGFDLGVLKALFKNAVVIGMRQLVQREVRHALGLALEDANVRELDRLFHGRIAFVFAQPDGSGVIFGTRLRAGVLGRNPQRHLLQFGQGRGRNHTNNLRKLSGKKLQRPRGLFLLLLEQFVADEKRPAFDLACLPAGDLRRLGGVDSILRRRE